MAQSRNWLVTGQMNDEESMRINSSAGALKDTYTWWQNKAVKYCCYQIERAPTTGKIHMHAVIILKSTRKTAFIKNLVGNNPHVETVHDLKKAIEYCKKEESRIGGPWEHGVAPIHHAGKRNDLTDIYAAVKARKRPFEMLEEDPTIARYEKSIKYMKFALSEGLSDRQTQGVKTYVFWGPTDTGKTYTAINGFCSDGDYYIAEAPSQKGGRLWFDGYEGQRTLILDDFSQDVCNLEYLKRLLDCYKLKLEVKGGYTWAQWTTIIITANYEPRNWYTTGLGTVIRDLAPLQRRIYEIRHFTTRGVYVKESWDGIPIGEPVDSTMPATLPIQIPSPLVLCPDTPVQQIISSAAAHDNVVLSTQDRDDIAKALDDDNLLSCDDVSSWTSD
jgi:hypothetical protein